MMGGSKRWRRARYVGLGAVVATVAVASLALARANFEGTSGDDSFTAEHGSSTAYLRAGNDSFTGAPGKGGGVDHVKGGPDNDTVDGKSFDDLLHGNGGEDTIRGGRGIDGLHGGGGDDTLIGGAGRDVFRPKTGNDTCFGQLKDRGFPGRCEHAKIAKP
jgi:Ca2+-binding RTX toxin-like protein